MTQNGPLKIRIYSRLRYKLIAEKDVYKFRLIDLDFLEKILNIAHYLKIKKKEVF